MITQMEIGDFQSVLQIYEEALKREGFETTVSQLGDESGLKYRGNGTVSVMYLHRGEKKILLTEFVVDSDREYDVEFVLTRPGKQDCTGKFLHEKPVDGDKNAKQIYDALLNKQPESS